MLRHSKYLHQMKMSAAPRRHSGHSEKVKALPSPLAPLQLQPHFLLQMRVGGRGHARNALVERNFREKCDDS